MTKASDTPKTAAEKTAAREVAMSVGGHAGVTDAADVAQTSPLTHEAGSVNEDKKITEAPPTPISSVAPPPGDSSTGTHRAKRSRLSDREIKNAAYEKHSHQMDSSECTAFLQGVRYAEEQHGVTKET